MATSLMTTHAEEPPDARARPPVGPAFVAFTGVVGGLSVLAAAEAVGPLAPTADNPSLFGSHFGVVACTTFTIAGLLALYRALTMRNGWVGAIAAVLLGPGAAWSWSTFVVGGPGSELASSLVVVAAGVLAVVLLTKGLRLAHWLEVFGGLGSCGLAVVALLIRLNPSATGASTPALLAAVSGMICLYGLLVDLELAEHRSLIELIESRRRIAEEVTQVEELLHDLRGGLLAASMASRPARSGPRPPASGASPSPGPDRCPTSIWPNGSKSWWRLAGPPGWR